MSVPVDWKPERAVQAKLGAQKGIYSRWTENPKGRSRQKLGIFTNKNKNKERLLKHAVGRTLCAHLQMATSLRPLIDHKLASQEASADTVCRVSYRQWPDLFTITSTPRKFAECWYCAVSPPPILNVLSCSIESPIVSSLNSRTS